jgi:DNA polymerase alpha subunit B
MCFPLQRVRLLPNPSTFYINEIMFSLCSVDVLFHLRKEEYFRRAEEAEVDVAMEVRKGGAGAAAKDSMAELCRHVLGQKRYARMINAQFG